jgi:hypothetical protein
MRLAKEHAVKVADLVGRVLTNIPNQYGEIIFPCAKVMAPGFLPCSYAVNGVTDCVMRWVHALETATG